MCQILLCEVKAMFKNGIGHMGLNMNKFVDTPKKCGNEECEITLKNKKRYILTRVIERNSGYWTVVKVCRKCGYENYSNTGEE